MRRTLLVLVGSMVSVVVLIGLKAAPTAALLGWSAEAGLEPDGMTTGDAGGMDAGTGAPPADPGATGPSGAPGLSPGPAASGSPSPGGSTSAPAPGTSTAPTRTTSAPGISGTFTGAAIAVKTAQQPTVKSGSCGDCHDYAMSVTIVVAGGRITKATVAYSTSPGSSQTYATKANNQLSQSILTAQTWKLGRVSGATYSGNAFELSVKDAMTKAGLPV